MKHLRITILLTVAILTLSACTAQEEASLDVISEDTAVADGTYQASGDKWDFGHEEATVVIKDSKIQEITLQRIDLEGNEIDYKAYQEMGGPDLSDATAQLSEAMIEEQSINIDIVSGATVSSNNWKKATERALVQARIY